MSDFVPEVGSDGRQRPRFGEYATPEEQRARIQVPDVTEALAQGVAPGVATTATETAQTRGSAQAAAGRAPIPVAPAPAATSLPPVARPPRTADRIATAVLLAFGLFNVMTSVPALFDYAGYLQVFLSAFGVEGELADPGAGAAWGFSAAMVLIGGWVLTAIVCLRSLRRGRLTFWIPLVAGFVFNSISATFMIMPIMNDPVLWPALQATILA